MAEVHENATWLMEYRNGQFVPFLRQYAGGLWTPDTAASWPTTRPRFPPRLREMFSDPRWRLTSRAWPSVEDSPGPV